MLSHPGQGTPSTHSIKGAIKVDRGNRSLFTPFRGHIKEQRAKPHLSFDGTGLSCSE
jgi:hypothetical protein